MLHFEHCDMAVLGQGIGGLKLYEMVDLLITSNKIQTILVYRTQYISLYI